MLFNINKITMLFLHTYFISGSPMLDLWAKENFMFVPSDLNGFKGNNFVISLPHDAIGPSRSRKVPLYFWYVLRPHILHFYAYQRHKITV